MQNMQTPVGLDLLVGLTKIKQLARIDIDYCKQTGNTFGHTMIFGVGGLGKSELVSSIAQELNYHLVTREAASLKNRDIIVDNIIQALSSAKNLNKKLLFFVDEAHKLSLTNQEVFYYPLDKLNPRIITPKGEIGLSSFCIMAATTRRDVLDEASFILRFDNIWEIERYSDAEICRIIGQWMVKENLLFDFNILDMIAQRCLGIPRQAIRLSKKIRKYVVSNKRYNITEDDCRFVFELEGIDSIGLTNIHRRYLSELIGGLPKGLDAISAKIGQKKEVVGSIEPILMSLKLIDIVSKGRILTPKGIEYLGL